MVKVVTSVGLFNDAVGKRITITYSEINEETGQIISDNKRTDRVITNNGVKAHVVALEEYAQELIDSIE